VSVSSIIVHESTRLEFVPEFNLKSLTAIFPKEPSFMTQL